MQRGFGLLPVIGLTSTLMITWEVITSSVGTCFAQLHHRETDGRCGVQDLVQRTRKWWSSGIDIWVSICLVRGDTSSSGHGRDGFDVCFQHGDLYGLVLFVLLLPRDLRRIWISFRQHPHDSALGRRVGGGRPFGPRNLLCRSTIAPRYWRFCALLQAL